MKKTRKRFHQGRKTCLPLLLIWVAATSAHAESASGKTELGLPVTVPSVALTPAPQFQSGDRWAAVGDSITHTGLYTRYIYLFYATRFPDRPLDFFNCGISGDTAKGTVLRLEKDILRHKPTVATIMLGMNDVRRSLYTAKFDAPDKLAQRDAAIDIHFASMCSLAEKLQASGIRMIFVTPSIFDDTADWQSERGDGINAALARCAENTAKIAAKFKGGLVDLHGPMSRLNLDLQKSDPSLSLIGPDRVHPKELGAFVMAYLFLKAQGIPRLVDDIAVNAGGKSELTFTHTAKALPFPVPAECSEALKLVPFTEELNQERLRVERLPVGRYQLSIDDQLIGSFSSQELLKGINLATFANTPQNLQARAVEKLDVRRYELVQTLRTIEFNELWHNPNFGTDKPFDWQASLAKRSAPVSAWAIKDREIYLQNKPRELEVRREKEALVAEIGKASQPKPHRFRLRKE